MPKPPTPAPTESEHHHPLIGRQRWEAWRELMNGHGNAFAVGGSGRGVVVLAWDFLSRPLGRAEVANLVTWLLLVSDVEPAELEAVCKAQGISLRALLDLEPPAAVCGECGGELAAKCTACGKSFP